MRYTTLIIIFLILGCNNLIGQEREKHRFRIGLDLNYGFTGYYQDPGSIGGGFFSPGGFKVVERTSSDHLFYQPYIAINLNGNLAIKATLTIMKFESSFFGYVDDGSTTIPDTRELFYLKNIDLGFKLIHETTLKNELVLAIDVGPNFHFSNGSSNNSFFIFPKDNNLSIGSGITLRMPLYNSPLTIYGGVSSVFAITKYTFSGSLRPYFFGPKMGLELRFGRM